MSRLGWTDERDARLRKLFGLRMRDEEIAADLGVTTRAVANRRYRRGLVRRRLATQLRQLTDEKLIEELERRGLVVTVERLPSGNVHLW